MRASHESTRHEDGAHSARNAESATFVQPNAAEGASPRACQLEDGRCERQHEPALARIVASLSLLEPSAGERRRRAAPPAPRARGGTGRGSSRRRGSRRACTRRLRAAGAGRGLQAGSCRRSLWPQAGVCTRSLRRCSRPQLCRSSAGGAEAPRGEHREAGGVSEESGRTELLAASKECGLERAVVRPVVRSAGAVALAELASLSPTRAAATVGPAGRAGYQAV